MYQIKQFSEITNVSVRQLRHYDKIGVLKAFRQTNSYRWYNDSHIRTLNQILIYKELEFSLREIKTLLSSKHLNKRRAIEKQKVMLKKKVDRLNRIIEHIDNLLTDQGETPMTTLGHDETDNDKNDLLKEAKSRWGHTAAYKQSEIRRSGYSKQELKTIQKEQNKIYSALAEKSNCATSDKEVQELVHQARMFIDKHWYDCDPKQFAALGQMYVNDKRFQSHFDAFGDGFAQFFSDAIKVYCKNLEDS
jgi:DNA-binding transcriptional MerR regulator